MDTFDEPPEVQIPTPAPAAERGSQTELSAAVPPELPPEAPPVVAPPVVPGAVKKDGNPFAWVYWTLGIVFGIFILAVIFGSGSGSGTSSSGKSSTGGGGSTPPPASAPLDFRPVSTALDEKNGFKDFRFGMTLSEARAVLEPTRVAHNPGANEETFLYSGTAVNRIGEFATDTVSLQFFEGRLFRVNIGFTGSPNEIFEALKISYGETFDSTDWKRGERR